MFMSNVILNNSWTLNKAKKEQDLFMSNVILNNSWTYSQGIERKWCLWVM